MKRLDKYKVDDLRAPDESNQIIFVLESPHTEEFAHGHPVAGQAGKRLASLLERVGLISTNESQFPLGCLIKSGKIVNIAVMNVSQIPLDRNFYCNSDSELSVIKCLSSVKYRLQKSTLASFQPNQGIESDLFDDFLVRLNSLVLESTEVIIPLGHFASNFVKSANLQSDTVFYGVQHPSSRTWSSPKNVKLLQDAIEKVSKSS